MMLLYFVISIGLQLVFWLVPNIIAGATALSIMGFFQGPFFATVSDDACVCDEPSSHARQALIILGHRESRLRRRYFHGRSSPPLSVR